MATCRGWCIEILLETGLSPSRLELEITEGVLIGDFTRAVAILRRLKNLGVRIAMDDFGTGYSSLSYLQSFPFDKIKIDQAFVANLGHSQQAATIIRAVIALGRGLNLPVVAEGVETEEQLRFLARRTLQRNSGLSGRAAETDRRICARGRARDDRSPAKQTSGSGRLGQVPAAAVFEIQEVCHQRDTKKGRNIPDKILSAGG